jgi:hypothetical protein
MCPDTDRRDLLLLRQQCMVDAAAKSLTPQEAHSLSSVHTALTYQMAENRERAAKSSHEASSGPKCVLSPLFSQAVSSKSLPTSFVRVVCHSHTTKQTRAQTDRCAGE